MKSQHATFWRPGYVLALALALWAGLAESFTVAYCSGQNTGADGESTYSIFMSDGRCQNFCGLTTYAFAVVQGKNCWCSDYIPADQLDTGECQVDCPGYPDDKCGNPSKGYYGYIALDKSPSGTMGASSSVAAQTSSVSNPIVITSMSVSTSSLVSSSSHSTSARARTSNSSRKHSTGQRTTKSSSSKSSRALQATSRLLSFLAFSSTSISTLSTFTPLSLSLPMTTILTTKQSSAPQSSSPASEKQTSAKRTTVYHTVTPSAEVITSFVVSNPPSSSPAYSSAKLTSSEAPYSSTVAAASSTADSTSSSSSSSSTWTPTPMTSTLVKTVSGNIVTQFVTTMPTSPAQQMQPVRKSISGGAIAGAVIGGLFGLALIVAGALFFIYRRRRQEDRAASDTEAPRNSPRRNVSTLSKTGLLRSESEKWPGTGSSTVRNSTHALGTFDFDHADDSGVSPISERRNSRPLFYDQRLNPAALMFDHPNGSHASIITIEDNRDYGRVLGVTNPDPDHDQK